MAHVDDLDIPIYKLSKWRKEIQLIKTIDCVVIIIDPCIEIVQPGNALGLFLRVKVK